jgi:hypothetical protein
MNESTSRSQLESAVVQQGTGKDWAVYNAGGILERLRTPENNAKSELADRVTAVQQTKQAQREVAALKGGSDLSAMIAAGDENVAENEGKDTRRAGAERKATGQSATQGRISSPNRPSPARNAQGTATL